MLRTHTCGELRIADVNKQVVLCGWVAKVRDKGGMIWVDVRDRYGITQLILDEVGSSKEVIEAARTLGREFVIKTSGKVIERLAKNNKIPTGDIEVKAESIEILNPAKLPPFLIEDDTDGGDESHQEQRDQERQEEPPRTGAGGPRREGRRPYYLRYRRR